MSNESEQKYLEGPRVAEPWRDVLMRAAALIEERGWQQRWFGDFDRGPYCMVGAILATRDDARHEAHKRALDYTGSCMFFNDATGRTAAEVIAKLREVASAP